MSRITRSTMPTSRAASRTARYGAGRVETWDRGTWSPIGDPSASMGSGELQFVLHGRRLAGRFRLVRLKRRERSRRETWFLIKGHDGHERPGADALALEAELPAPAPPKAETGARSQKPAPGARRGALPRKQAPQLCVTVAQAPTEPGWISEIKHEGIRLLAALDHGEVRLASGDGDDWADRLPGLARALAAIPARTALLDGELVALREGRSSLSELQAALSADRDHDLVYYAFDLLHLNGWDLRPSRLLDRKQALAALGNWRGTLRYSDHVLDRVDEMRRQACDIGVDAIICKRADAYYRPGTSADWVKLECRDRDEHAPAPGESNVGPSKPLRRRPADRSAAWPTPLSAPRPRVVVARAPQRGRETIGGVEISHADRPLWPGLTKRDLAEYWLAVAKHALPWLGHRPLAILRCPEGSEGEHFFQKRGNGLLPAQIREGSAGGSPYLALDDAAGLVAMAQLSAVELHPWGASEADPLRPDWIVFDLDPGEGVPFTEVVVAAHDMRHRLERLGFAAFPRTTGGKGLHVVVPVVPRSDWDQTKAFCRGLAEAMSQAEPERFLPTLSKAERRGRILLDYLRNGLGATAVASFCPRARPGACVATPLAWSEVEARLDPRSFTIRTVPERLRKQRRDPWAGFRQAARPIPRLTTTRPKSSPSRRSPPPEAPAGLGTALHPPVIVYAPKSRKRERKRNDVPPLDTGRDG